MSADSAGRSLTDQDDIEYNITFPTANNCESEPVVFMLGWVGSKDKHLAKYSTIYEKEGCITIRYIHPFKSVLFTDPSESKEHEEAAVKLVQLLEDYGLVDNPVFVHVFSNGGYFVYRFLAEAFHKRQVNVTGAVFDSCPSQLNYFVAVKALINSGILPNIFVSFFCAIAFTFYAFLVYIKTLFSWNKNEPLYELMKHSPFHSWPHLFLYSSADVIVPRQHIEEMATARDKAGVMFVHKYDFKTSPHVMHFKLFPQVYAEKCVQFFHDCLKVYDGDDIEDIEGSDGNSNHSGMEETNQI